MRKRLTTLFLLSSLAALAAQAGPAAPAGTYRWVDEQGRVHYSDQIPPNQSDRAYKIINPRGITIKNVDQAKTPEQFAEEQRLKDIKEEETRRTKDRAMQDRILLDTYTTEHDLIETRDRHLATLEGLIDVSQHKLSNLSQEEQKLTKVAARLERQGKPVPGELRGDIATVQSQIERERSFIRGQRAQQVDIRAKFAADLARYKDLKSAQN
ncbi:MAG: DUF4124 domain-containing protein [Pseudomonadota bacterium]